MILHVKETVCKVVVRLSENFYVFRILGVSFEIIIWKKLKVY